MLDMLDMRDRMRMTQPPTIARMMLYAAVLLGYLPLHALEAPDTAGLRPARVAVIAGGTVAGFVAGHVVLNDLWWKGERVPFHVNTDQDYTYALGADKAGHATFAYATTTIYGQMFRWAGMDSVQSLWWAAGVSTTYQTYIEIRDGFSRDYGFSWGDVVANTVGASLPLLQHAVPELRALDLQISFWPSDAFRQGAYGAIIDDYTSTTHWLSVRVHDWLPAQMQRWYPPWLGLAVGHSVERLDGRGGGNHSWYLSFDWRLDAISGLPPWLRELARALHLYHLPAPAVKIYPEVVWYGLRF